MSGHTVDYSRSLAFTALLELKEWFRRLSVDHGQQAVTALLEDYDASEKYADGHWISLWQFTETWDWKREETP